MRKNRLRTIIRGLFLVFAFSFFPTLVHGDSLDSFDAVIHPSDHQINQEQSYFNLKYQPDESERLTVTLTNRTDQTIKLKTSFNRTITNSLGVIEYSGTNKDDSNFGLNITDYVKLNTDLVELAGNESKDIYLDVKMPAKAFDGVLAGGLYIEEVSEGKIEGNIRNVFSREIAVLLRNSTDKVTPDLKITKAEASQVNGRNAIITTIDNEKATYVSDVTIDYQVVKDDKTIVKNKKEKLAIAPSSRFPYMISMDENEFSAGKYTVKMTITSGNQKWTGSPSFTINQKKATDYNDKDVTIEKRETNPWLLIGGIIIVLLIAIVVFMYMRYRKLKKKLNEK